MLLAYWEMMPTLEARESIQQSTIVGMGTGSYKDVTMREISGRWERMATRRKNVAQSDNEILMKAASLGLQVQVVTPTPDTETET